MKDWLKHVFIVLACILCSLGVVAGLILGIIWAAAFFQIDLGLVLAGVLIAIFAITFGTGAYLEERKENDERPSE